MEWSRVFGKIMEIKPYVELIVKDRCIKRGDCVVIYDNPLEIELHNDCVRFLLENETAGILTANGLEIFEERAREEIEYWCIALSSTGFKRFSIKRKQ